MRWKGRRESTNVEDLRGSGGGGSRIGLKGGIIGTLAIAFVIYLLGGNPLEVLNITNDGSNSAGTEVTTSAAEEEMVSFISVVLADIEDVWNEQFRLSGRTYREPKLVLFRNQVQSACGYSSAATGPFYCPGDEKVYIDLDFLDAMQQRLGATGDFAIAYILAHEVGHHVQNQLGIMDQMTRLQSGSSQRQYNDYMVRLELQADFLAGFWVHHAEKAKGILESGDINEALNAAAAVGDDRIQKQSQGYVVPDSFTHGTSEQRSYWLRRGIETGNLEMGDTFSANLM